MPFAFKLSSSVSPSLSAWCSLGFFLIIFSFPTEADEVDFWETMQLIRPQTILPAPDFSLPTLSGDSTLHLSDFRGRLVLLTFWATWCAPCREEMPAMQSLWKRYQDQGFSLLAVNIEINNQKQVRRFVKKYMLDFPILLDRETTVRKRYEIEGLPTSYLIDRQGRFLGKIVGNQPWQSEAAQHMISTLLKTPPDPQSRP